MADYRFARRPRWIVGHLLVAGLVVVMVSLGFWQLRRLDQRRDTNALVEARSDLAPVLIGEQMDPGDGGPEVDRLRFRSVTASGRYTGAATTVRASQDGASGGRAFAVLELADGEAVAVLRGFARLAPDGSVPVPAPPAGEVEVEGLAIPRARLELVSRQALDDLEAEVPGLLPVIVQASDPDADGLAVVPPPDLGEGPHLSYAVQWFLFAAVGAIGYPLLLRHRAREGGGRGDGEDDGP
jgi:cytochrome oxidase assembly protein ShyY1